MPVLLLAQGDPHARDILKKAIQARYGLRPPALESARVAFKGRARAKVGPIHTWVPVEVVAWFRFPTAMRWDFIVRAAGVPLASGVESFDGTTYRSGRGGKPPTVNSSLEQIQSAQGRLWAVAALFLTPLGEMFVRLSADGDMRIEARNVQINSAVVLQMRPDMSLEEVSVRCLNPDNDHEQVFRLTAASELVAVNDLMLPTRVQVFWDDDPYLEIEPVEAESNPAISDAVFTLEDSSS